MISRTSNQGLAFKGMTIEKKPTSIKDDVKLIEEATEQIIGGEGTNPYFGDSPFGRTQVKIAGITLGEDKISYSYDPQGNDSFSQNKFNHNNSHGLLITTESGEKMVFDKMGPMEYLKSSKTNFIPQELIDNYPEIKKATNKLVRAIEYAFTQLMK